RASICTWRRTLSDRATGVGPAERRTASRSPTVMVSPLTTAAGLEALLATAATPGCVPGCVAGGAGGVAGGAGGVTCAGWVGGAVGGTSGCCWAWVAPTAQPMSTAAARPRTVIVLVVIPLPSPGE